MSLVNPILSGPGHAVSCDGSVNVWDPFIMSTVSEYEVGNKITFSAAKCIPDPGKLTVINQILNRFCVSSQYN